MNLVIHIDDIPDDEEYMFDLVEKPDYFKVDPEDGVLKKDVCVRGRLSRAGQEVFLNGTVSTDIELICSRCLEPLMFPVQAKLSAHYVPGPDRGQLEADVELHVSDTDVELYNEGQIDLTQAVYDQMLLSLPLVRLCREDCQGICPECGVNRNKTECQCSGQSSIDPRLEVLRTLKDKLK